MAQAFVTTTMDSYRWHPMAPREGKYESLYTKYLRKPAPEEKGEWIDEDNIDPTEKYSEISNFDLKKEIHKLRKQFYLSTYIDEICHAKDIYLKRCHLYKKGDDEEETMSKKGIKVPTELDENDMVLLTKAASLYNPTRKPKLPPIETFREVFGYNRPSRFYSKLGGLPMKL